MSEVSVDGGGLSDSGGGLSDSGGGIGAMLGTSNERVIPTLKNAILVAGGFATAYGMARIGNESRGAIVALSLLAMAMGFALLALPALKAAAPAGLGMLVTGLFWFARLSTRNEFEPESFDDLKVGGALALIMIVAAILYFVPKTKGQPIFLGLTLGALWALLMSTYVDFFGLGLVSGNPTFELGLGDLGIGVSAEKGAYLSMIIGLVYLGATWFLDQQGAKGAATAVAAAAVVAFGYGVFGTLDGNPGRGIIAILGGVAFAYVGGASARRAITWTGGVGVAVGLLTFVRSLFDNPGTGAGFLLTFLGLVTVGAAAGQGLMADGALDQLKAKAAAAGAAGGAAIAAADSEPDGGIAPPPAPGAPAPPPAPATAAAQPADWYADPSGNFELRWFDGTDWTEHVSTGGERSEDPPG